MPFEKKEKPEDTVAVISPVPGKPLPEGFDNPAPGDDGHYCLDPKGNYQPTWCSVMIFKDKQGEVGDRQMFNIGNAHPVYVKTGMWCDVPPKEPPTFDDPNGVVMEVVTEPRFKWNHVKSA